MLNGIVAFYRCYALLHSHLYSLTKQKCAVHLICARHGCKHWGPWGNRQGPYVHTTYSLEQGFLPGQYALTFWAR